jgi:hypothetical protein
MKKKLRKSLAETPSRRSRERESRESVSTDSQNRLSISLRKSLDKVADMILTEPIQVRRAFSAAGFSTDSVITLRREAFVAVPRRDLAPAIRCRASP